MCFQTWSCQQNCASPFIVLINCNKKKIKDAWKQLKPKIYKKIYFYTLCPVFSYSSCLVLTQFSPLTTFKHFTKKYSSGKFYPASLVRSIFHVWIFHPSPRSGRDWGEVRGEQEEEKEEGEEEEEEGRRVCCCPELVGVKVIIAVFAVFNLGIIATGDVQQCRCP